MTGETDCSDLLPSKIQKGNGSELNIPQYTFTYGTNYTITYNLTDPSREYSKEILIMTRISPIDVDINIT